MKFNNKIAISDTGFIFDPTTGESFSVNPIGLEIIKLIKQGKSVEEIRALLLEKYEVTEAVLSKILDEFITTLIQLSIVVDE
ncbi:MAG: PqqD family protein [Ignavibacteria bacterium]